MNQRWKIPQAHVSDKQEPLLEVVPIIPHSYWEPESFHRCIGPNIWIDGQHAAIVDTLRHIKIVEVVIDIIMGYTGFDHIGALAANLYSLWVHRWKCCGATPTVTVALHPSLCGGVDGNMPRWLILNHRLDVRPVTDVMYIDVYLCRSEYFGHRRSDKKDTAFAWQEQIYYEGDIGGSFGQNVVVIAKALRLDESFRDDEDFPALVADNSIVQVCAANLVTSLDVRMPALVSDGIPTIGKKRAFGTMDNE